MQCQTHYSPFVCVWERETSSHLLILSHTGNESKIHYNLPNKHKAINHSPPSLQQLFNFYINYHVKLVQSKLVKDRKLGNMFQNGNEKSKKNNKKIKKFSISRKEGRTKQKFMILKFNLNFCSTIFYNFPLKWFWTFSLSFLFSRTHLSIISCGTSPVSVMILSITLFFDPTSISTFWVAFSLSHLSICKVLALVNGHVCIPNTILSFSPIQRATVWTTESWW